MPVSAPEVSIEAIILSGFADIKANAATQVPLILTSFPADYINFAISYISDLPINTVFQYYFDPSILPTFNIILSNEGESFGDKHSVLNDNIESAETIPNTQNYSMKGSDWDCSVTVVIRTEKMRQCIVCSSGYSLKTEVFLKQPV
jgi:hypothetical protein